MNEATDAGDHRFFAPSTSRTTDSTAGTSLRPLDQLLSTLKSVARIVFVILNNFYCIPTYVIWMTLIFPLKYYQPRIYWRIEGTFFHWLLAMVSMWSWSAGYDIIEEGDDIRGIINEKTLVLANHQSTGDVPMLMATFNSKPNVLPNIMWIMDKIFKYTNFGLVSVLHKDFFILSGRKRREEGIRLLEKHLLESYIALDRKWMVLFPEGGFLCKRRETSQSYARKNNLPILENVTLPRVGALQAIFNVIGPTPNNNTSQTQTNLISSKPEIKWILDITVAYPQGKPIDLPTIITGSRPPCRTHLYYRVYPSAMVPREPEQLSKWLFDRWDEKERLLEHFYRCGAFVGTKAADVENAKIQQDPLRFLVLHLFFMTSSYLHYNMFLYITSYFW